MKNFNENELIGKRIKEVREKAGLTQNSLHNATGISITQISAYENGKRNIGLNSLKKIADATGTSMDFIYSGSDEEKPIINALNHGKLIINCITALFDNDVITVSYKINDDIFAPEELEYNYQIVFLNYTRILNEYVKQLIDFKKNKDNYPNPNDFKKQLIEAASKRINQCIASKN